MSIDKIKIYELSVEARKKLGVSKDGAIDIFALVQKIPHLSLILYPLSDNISGMCIKRENDTVIVVNSGMSIGRQNFSIAHELYHFYFDKNKKTFVCNNRIGKGSEIEQAADQFASFLLIPVGELSFSGNNITIDTIIELEQLYKVSHMAMLYRLLDENFITSAQFGKFKDDIIKIASHLGFDTSLYKPSGDKKKYKTYGYYIRQVQQMQSKDVISEGKYEQLLLESFREDIVYGEDEEIELND